MNHRKIFSNIGWAYFLLLAITIALQMLLSFVFLRVGFAGENEGVTLLISLAPMYLVGMPVCVQVLKKIPKKQLYEHTMKFGKWMLCLCIALFVMYAGNILGNLINTLITNLTGLNTDFDLQQIMTGGSLWVTFLFSVVLAPILEELVFRKALIDRAIIFGDKTVILLSGFLFGIFHGNFHQLFYAFGIGCMFAYIYIRTGNIKYTISLHMAVNFLGGFLPSIFLKGMDYTDLLQADLTAYLAGHLGWLILYLVYLLCMIGAAIAGLVFFILSVKKWVLRPGAYSLPAREMAGAMFGNVGILLFCAGCVWLFVTDLLL